MISKDYVKVECIFFSTIKLSSVLLPEDSVGDGDGM
jgi:hypothetical protein